MKASQTRDCAHSEADCFSGTYIAVNQEWEVCNASVLLHGAYRGQVFNIISLLQAVFPILLNMTEYPQWIQRLPTVVVDVHQRGTEYQAPKNYRYFSESLCFFREKSPFISILESHLLEIHNTGQVLSGK